VQTYLKFILKHRWLVLTLVFVVTCGAGLVMTRGVFASSMVRLFFGESEKYDQYEKLMEEFGASDIMVVAYDEPEIFSARHLSTLKKVSECLEGHKDVRRVNSIADAQRLSNTEDSLVIESYLDLVTKTPTLSGSLRSQALKENSLAGLLISKDGKSTAVGIEFLPDDGRPSEDLPILIQDVYGCFDRHGIKKERLHGAGVIVEASEATAVAIETVEKTVPFTSLFLVIIVFILFRRFWPVTITAGIAVISVIWTVAFAVALDPQINIMLSAVPAVMMVVCFSDVIHLCSAYLLELKGGADKTEAINKSAAEVGVACLFTSITTFVGFISLSFVPTPAFQQLGAVLGFGVAVALLLAVTLAPIYFSIIPVPDTKSTDETNPMQTFVNAVSNKSLRLSTTYPKIVAGSFVLVLIVSAFGASQIKVEADFLGRLSPKSQSRIDSDYMRARFAGSNVVDIYIGTEEDDGIMNPELMAKVAQAERDIVALPEVDDVLSIVDLYGEMGRTMGTPRLPDTKQGLAQYLLLFEMSGGDSLERMINDPRNKTRMSLRLNGTGLVKTAEVGDKAASILRDALGKSASVTPTGMTYLLGDWVDEILTGQARGLIFAFLVTTIMMMICLRSFRAALISMIPNALPLIVLGGYLGLTWDTVDSDLAFIALIAIGIGVDDTIHFLTRLRLESLRTDDTQEALKNTFYFTGRAIVQTTVILTGGFLPFLWTDYLSLKVMGSLLPMCLIVALVADLLFVPALVKLKILKF
jgi:uncharacterized protein